MFVLYNLSIVWYNQRQNYTNFQVTFSSVINRNGTALAADSAGISDDFSNFITQKIEDIINVKIDNLQEGFRWIKKE